MTRVLSFFQHKKQTGQNILLTDELINFLAEEYGEVVAAQATTLTFQQWVEYRMVSWY